MQVHFIGTNFCEISREIVTIYSVYFILGKFKMPRVTRCAYDVPFPAKESSNNYARANTPIDKSASRKSCISEYLCGGGAIFVCTLLLALVMLFLIIQLLIWRIFDIDIFPVDDTISNKELSNYTFSSFHRPTD